MKIKILLLTISVLAFGYIALSLLRAYQLNEYGEFTAILWQISIVIIAGLSFGLIIREIVFGIQLQKLAKILNEKQLLLPDTLEKMPSGRTIRSEADERFEHIKLEVEEKPNSWECWFRLGLAYDEAGDRHRARMCMRRAIKLFRSS
ncbi:MAG: hypothetical protein RIS09_950 [Actinomycetota bacterium]|jgi:tetratricopeptide (TPR) repeat protein